MVHAVVTRYLKEDVPFNSAEMLVYAAAEAFCLDLSEDVLRAVAPFGGGMGVGETCGAVSGALVVIGLLYTRGTAGETLELADLSRAFLEAFKASLSSMRCKDLKEGHPEGCGAIILLSARLLDTLINRTALSRRIS